MNISGFDFERKSILNRTWLK